MRTRLSVLLLALVASGCTSVSDHIIARLGGPGRGFLTPPVFSDGTAATDRCTGSGCDPAPASCVARGYRRGSDAYNLCIVTVEQSLRR